MSSDGPQTASRAGLAGESPVFRPMTNRDECAGRVVPGLGVGRRRENGQCYARGRHLGLESDSGYGERKAFKYFS